MRFIVSGIMPRMTLEDAPRTQQEALQDDPLGGVGRGVAGWGEDLIIELPSASHLTERKELPRGTNPLLLPGVRLSKSSTRFWTRKLNADIRKKKRLEEAQRKRKEALKIDEVALESRGTKRGRPKHLHWTQKRARFLKSATYRETRMKQGEYYYSPRGRYVTLRRDLKARKVEMLLTYEQWLELLEEVGFEVLTTGKTEYRRIDPKKAFSIDNIMIVVGDTVVYPYNTV